MNKTKYNDTKVRIFYFSITRFPWRYANSIQILHTTHAMAKKGNEVHLFVRKPPQEEVCSQEEILDHYGLCDSPNLNIHQVPVINVIYKAKKWTLIYYFILFLNSIPYLIFKKPSVIYTRDPLLILLYRIFGWIFGILLAYEIHIPIDVYYKERKSLENNFSIKGEKKRAILIEDGAINLSNKIVVITKKLEELYLKKGISKEKIIVAPDGVDLRLFKGFFKLESRNELKIPIHKKIICYTGTLHKWKGVYILAKSMESLPDSILYVIGGKTDLEVKKFREFVNNEKIKNVVVVGYVKPNQIPKFVSASDVVVLPNTSRENTSKYYTSPLKLFEYMASKKPIVASDLPSIREILNEENAILVEPDNPKALAEGIKNVLEDEELAKKLTEKAYEEVQKYTWDKRAEKILKELME